MASSDGPIAPSGVCTSTISCFHSPFEMLVSVLWWLRAAKESACSRVTWSRLQKFIAGLGHETIRNGVQQIGEEVVLHILIQNLSLSRWSS